MLILSRKNREVVVIQVGDITIRVSVNKIEQGKVRLAFEAPDHVFVDREEIFLLRQKERNQE